jgi:hypothetical protein
VSHHFGATPPARGQAFAWSPQRDEGGPNGTALAYALVPQGCLDGVVTGVELSVVAGFFAFLALVPV